MADIVAPVEVREPLFETLPEEDLPIQELIDTRRSFQAIAYYREVAKQAASDMGTYVAKLEAELDRVRDFYARKSQAANAREAFHIQNLANYITQTGKKKVATPYGTAFFRTRKKVTWPEDANALIRFAQDEGADEDLLKTTYTPRKPEILKYIHATGAVPEGFSEEEVTDVQVRLAAEPADEESA
jgi:hypothetical protein